MMHALVARIFREPPHVLQGERALPTHHVADLHALALAPSNTSTRTEQHACRRAVRIEFSSSVNDAPLSRSDAASGVEHLGLAAHLARLAPHRSDVVNLHLK